MTAQELKAILNGTHGNPFHVLGPHQTDAGWEVRAFLPQAMDAAIRVGGATPPTRQTGPGGGSARVRPASHGRGNPGGRRPPSHAQDALGRLLRRRAWPRSGTLHS